MGRLVSAKKFSGGFHTGLPQIGGDVLAVHPTEVVFQTGFSNGEFFRQQTHGDMFPEICGEDLFCFLAIPT